jgi:RNA polymerase sigma factor (sigma-70 family)
MAIGKAEHSVGGEAGHTPVGLGKGSAMAPSEELLSDLEKYARHRLPKVQLARDAAQEALDRAQAAVVNGKCEPDDLRPYSFGCLKNVIREQLRNNRPVTGFQGWQKVVAPDSAVDELREAIDHCRSNLSEHSQEVLRLRLERRTFTAIAQESGFSIETARRKYNEALKFMRDCLSHRLGISSEQ